VAATSSRRELLRLAAAAGALAAFPACRSAPLTAMRAAPREPGAASDPKGYLARGLLALSTVSPRGWVPGHGGAAVLAGHFFCVDNGLDARTEKAVHANLDAFIAANPADYPGSEPDPGPGTADVTKIVERIDPHMHEYRAGGHDKIYAALALRALRERPDYATPAIVDGVCRLLDVLYANRPAERPSPFAEANPLPPCNDPAQLAGEVLRAVLRPWSHVRDVGTSGVLHWVTHAEALLALEDLGWRDLARRGYVAHRQHIHRAIEDRGEALPARPAIEWLGAEYWESDRPRRLFQGTWLGGHAFKLPQALYHLLERVEDPLLGVASMRRAALLQAPFES
jgi:hypothetical protein